MAKRRANNEGTIYPDKEKGGYRVQLTAPDGRRISKRFKSPDSAVEWKNNQLSDFNKGKYVAPQSTTVKEWLKLWLEEYIKPNRKPRTAEDYESLFDNHLQDVYPVPIQDVVPYHIMRAYNAMRKKKMAESSILKLHNVLHNAFEAARKNKKIPINIMLDVDKPVAAKIKLTPPDELEINKLLTALKPTRIYTGVYIMSRTGMRRGEVLGLRWKDVDFDLKMLYIRQGLQRSKTKGLSAELPKTETSRREISIDDDVIEVLLEEQRRQESEDDLKNSKYVVCNSRGGPMEPRNFSRSFDDVRKEIGLKHVTRHMLRHAVASILVDNNVPIPEVAALLGHADQAFTYRRYVHPRKDATKKAAAAISAALKPKEESKGDGTKETNPPEQ